MVVRFGGGLTMVRLCPRKRPLRITEKDNPLLLQEEECDKYFVSTAGQLHLPLSLKAQERFSVVGKAVGGFSATSQAAFEVLLVLAQQRQCKLTYQREIARRMPDTYPAFVLAECDIKYCWRLYKRA